MTTKKTIVAPIKAPKKKKSLLQKVQELVPDGKFKGLTKILEAHELPRIRTTN